MVEYELPPLRYAAILSDHRTVQERCVRTMKEHWSCLLKLESLACTSPAAKKLLDDMHFARSSPNRILYMLYERGSWTIDFPPAVEFARAMFTAIPDSRVVEEHNEKLRDAARSCKHNVTSRVSRMQTLRNANVLEARGMPTISVSREQYVEEYRREPTLNRKSFESAKHPMPIEWEKLKWPGVRSWPSPTPSSSRRAVTAMHWCLNRGVLGVSAARCSCAFSSYSLVRRLRDGSAYYVLEPAKWGSIAFAIREVVADGLFAVRGTIEIVHATVLTDEFVVIPTSVCSPGRLAAEFPHLPASLGILLRRTGPDVSILRHLLSLPITINREDLIYLGSKLELPHSSSMSKPQLVEVLATYVANGELPEEARADFIRSTGIAATQGGDADDDADVFIDDEIEAVFDLIEPDNKEEFGDFGKSIKQRATRNKIAAARAIIAKAKARAKPRVKAKAKAAASPIVPAPAEPVPDPTEPVHPPLLPPQPDAVPAPRFLLGAPPPAAAAARAIDNHGVSFNWGAFVLGERMPTPDRPHGACWARCRYHDPEISRSGMNNLHCTKEWGLSEDLGRDACIQRLKWWCVSGSLENRLRKDHMKMGRTCRSLFAGQDTPTEAYLVELRGPWDTRAVALGIN